MKVTSWKSKIEKLSEIAVDKIKRKFKPIAIIQFGSSLRPSTMMIESDIDFLVVLKKKVKEKVEVLLLNLIEVAIHLLSKDEFLKGIKAGNPIVLMSLKFGKIIYDPQKLIKKYKPLIKPTEATINIWYENGWSIYQRAIFDYFSRTCVGCYLKDCHHSARSFLRAFLLKKKKILCEWDEEILANSPKEIRKFYKKIIDCRRKGKRFPFKLFVKIKTSKAFKDKEARPILALEKIVQYVVKELEGKKLRGLKEALRGGRGEVKDIWLDRKRGLFIVHNKGALEKPMFVNNQFVSS